MKTADFSFLMIDFETPKFISDLQDLIPESELYISEDNNDTFNYGLETETHVTLVPCMDNDTDVEELRKYLLPLDEYRCMIEDISVFENEEYDVLKCSVRCDNMHITNSLIRPHIESHSEFRTYHPHATVAYLKKGCAEKYAKQIITEPVFMIPKCFSFSWIENNELKKKIFK